MTFYTISALINALTSFFLGILVLTKNFKNKMNRGLSYFCFTVALWSACYLIWQISGTETQAIFWSKALMIWAVLIPIFYYRFVLIFLNLLKKNRVLFLCYILGIVFIISNFSNFLVSGVVPRMGFQFWPNHGLFYTFFLLMFFGLAAYSTYLLIKEYRKTSGIRKQQIKYIFLGMIVGFIGGSTNYFLWYNVNIPPIGNILVTFYVLSITYAIIAHHLMDIKLVLRRSFAYLAPLITVLVVYTIIQYLINLYLPEFVSVANIIILVLSVLVFIPLKNFYYRLANKYFFSSLYDSQEVLNDLSDKLRSSLNTKVICNLISKTLTDAFHSKAVGILIFNEKKNQYFVECNHGFDTKEQAKFPNDKLLQADFAQQNKILIVDEIRNNSNYKNSKRTIDLLNILGVEILAPLNIKDKMVGLIALSEKESGDMYNNEDLKVLKVVGAQTAVALKNSLLYQESQAFGGKLKKEVEKATHDLRIANEHLKQLDRAKTEFISITSHQLRTPLTGIKGYLSMFLEGDFGKLKEDQEKVMLDVFNNSNRLVRLVNIFLNVSRIEFGRLKLQKSKFDLFDLVDEISRELKLEADKKGIALEIVKPKEKLEVFADRDKIADVVLNLIDNGIKYTQKGKIKTSVILDKEKARVEVKDSGVGISPEEAKELFNKFVRGKKITQINTSGTGLGLFIAKKIIELHGGKIWVESKGEGKGSTFMFEILIK